MDIITRYGIPYKIISGNDTQFESKEFTDLCEKNDIIKSLSSVAHPQANG